MMIQQGGTRIIKIAVSGGDGSQLMHTLRCLPAAHPGACHGRDASSDLRRQRPAGRSHTRRPVAAQLWAGKKSGLGSHSSIDAVTRITQSWQNIAHFVQLPVERSRHNRHFRGIFHAPQQRPLVPQQGRRKRYPSHPLPAAFQWPSPHCATSRQHRITKDYLALFHFIRKAGIRRENRPGCLMTHDTGPDDQRWPRDRSG